MTVFFFSGRYNNSISKPHTYRHTSTLHFESMASAWRRRRDAFMLKVDPVHVVSVVRYRPETRCDAPVPVIVIHGGPGAASNVKHLTVLNRRQFDVVIFDQRGCGRSTPTACLRRNTTQHLVDDIEKVRAAVRRRTGDRCWDRAVVFGSSFGAVLAVLYASQYPEHVRAVVAHGFTRLQTFFSPKLRRTYPAIWSCLERAVDDHPRTAPPMKKPPATRVVVRKTRNRRQRRTVRVTRSPPSHPLYARCLRALQRGSYRVIRAWSALEGLRTQLSPATQLRHPPRRPHARMHTLALIECHYAAHDSFLPPGGIALPEIQARLARNSFPIELTHGADDVICDVADARALCARVPRARLSVIPHAGHDMSEPATHHCLCTIFARLADDHAAIGRRR